ncbi:class I SAM-dependent methyltransferase [Plantactinospora sp. B6F1]|uniref:class I SAM-dependent methyltransferase n=1 Tax=Plantactinospora sp. B6F1 TaxID=3158971 RepID=UPI0032D8F894
MTTDSPADRSLDAGPGQAVYSERILAIYDTGVLRIAQPLAWRCPSSRILALYDEHASADHLDIGVGTGYFLDRCRFPEPQPRITVLDMNSNSLAAAERRLSRYQIRTQQANVLEPIPLPARSFGSVGMNCLLHCLPGTLTDKAAALANVKALMRPGAVLFGSTVLVKGIRHNPLGRILVNSWNRRGIWSNRQDDLAGLHAAFSAHFERYEINLVGRSALFTAWA